MARAFTADATNPNNVIHSIRDRSFTPGYDLVGRVEVEPDAVIVTSHLQETNRRWLFRLYPVLRPRPSERGIYIRFRYAATRPGRRRLEAGIRNAAPHSAASTRRRRARLPALQTLEPRTHYSGFNAKTEDTTQVSWRSPDARSGARRALTGV